MQESHQECKFGPNSHEINYQSANLIIQHSIPTPRGGLSVHYWVKISNQQIFKQHLAKNNEENEDERIKQ